MTSVIANLPLGIITARFSVAKRRSSGATSTEWLLKYANQALYQAKENGRNRVEVVLIYVALPPYLKSCFIH